MENSILFNVPLKVTILGDSNVGKKTLLKSLINSKENESTIEDATYFESDF